jgi:hypothetical protein
MRILTLATLAGFLVVLISAVTHRADAAPPSPKPTDIHLSGEITDRDLHTYVEAPFDVPEHVTRVTVNFRQDGAAQRTTIDLGLQDPQRFRGWSGGNKTGFTVSGTDATPSYLAGDIPAGRWTLLLGVPNIRAGVVTRYTATIHFSYAGDRPAVSAFSVAPLKTGPAWYRGDLHLHTAHSDGHCLSQSGVSIACPVFRMLETAAARGLDFVVVTDHNTESQNNTLREMQPYFDRLLLIPGRELTTFNGHANAMGVTDHIDFRVDGRHVKDANALANAVHAAGGLLSINHPSIPSGEICMGCGWTAPGFDFALADAIEVVNGGSLSATGAADGALSGLGLWARLTDAGLHPTAVGGSDSHDADAQSGPGSVGSPTTVVYADDLSEAAILAGLRAGRVYIDVDAIPGRRLDMTLASAAEQIGIGGRFSVKAGREVTIVLRATGVAGGHFELESDGALTVLQPLKAAVQAPLSEDDIRSIRIRSDGNRHWLALRVRDAAGRLVLIANAVRLDGV